MGAKNDGQKMTQQPKNDIVAKNYDFSHPVSGLEVGHCGLGAAARGERGECQLVVTRQPEHNYH